MTDAPANGPIKNVRRQQQAVIIEVAGNIDLATSPMFQQGIIKLLSDKPERVIINFSEVPYMDSSGIASLVKVLSQVRANGASLHLVALTPRVRSLFEITRLDTVFSIHDTEQEALA